MSHGGLKRARSWKRRIQTTEAYSSPGLLYSEACVNFRQLTSYAGSISGDENLVQNDNLKDSAARLVIAGSSMSSELPIFGLGFGPRCKYEWLEIGCNCV
jgi:hypothetical protein